MNYRFYYPEWNNRKEVCKDYPQIKEITREPTAFWYGVGPKRTIRKTKKSIERLLKRADPYLPILVIYLEQYIMSIQTILISFICKVVWECLHVLDWVWL